MKDNPKFLGHGSLINVPTRKLIGNIPCQEKKDSIFHNDVWVGNYCSIGQGVVIEQGVIIDHNCTVESSVHIGRNTLLTYRSIVGSETDIGDDCVIGGFIGERSKIGNQCQIFGDIVHEHLNPLKGWDAEDSMEDGAQISGMVFMGFGSKITKPIVVGSNVYICPNAVVTKDVPPFHIVYGVNEMIFYKNWKGKLKNSPFFSG